MHRLGKAIALLTIFWLMAIPVAHATHIIGGELNYRCLGNDQYEVTLTIYRDCNNGDPDAYFDNPAQLGIFQVITDLVTGQDSIAPADTILMEFTGVDDTLSINVLNACLFVNNTICVHTTTYKDTVTLEPLKLPGGYILAYQRCCRNNNIINLLGDSEQIGATYSTFISTEALLNCNNGATFNDWPPFFICANEPFEFDHSATDVDGDSLVYRLCTPFDAENLSAGDGTPAPPALPPYDTVQWEGSVFTLSNLLGGIPLEIDPEDGFMTAVPNTLGKFVVGVCVEEYRNGVLISETRRDFQLNTGLCFPFLPPDPQCDLAASFQLGNVVYDTLTWFFFDDQNQLVGTSTDPNPDFTFPQGGIYTASLVATRGDCVDTFNREVEILGNTISADFAIQFLNCGDSSIVDVIDFSVDTMVGPIASWNWTLLNGNTQLAVSNDTNPVFLIPFTSDTLTLVQELTNANGCPQRDTLKFRLVEDADNDLLYDTLTVCGGDTVQLNPIAFPGYVYSWSPNNGFLSPSNIANPFVVPDTTTTYVLTITDSTGNCIITKFFTVFVTNVQADFTHSLTCGSLEVAFTDLSESADLYSWDFGVSGISSDTSLLANPSYVYPSPGVYTVSLTIEKQGECAAQSTISKDIQVFDPQGEALFEGQYTLCGVDSIVLELTGLSTGNIAEREWIQDGAVFSTDSSLLIELTDSDTLEITLAILTEEGCVDTLTRTLPVLFPTDLNLLDSLQLCPDTPTELYPEADTQLHYQWLPVDGLDDPSAPNPIATLDNDITYTVMISGQGVDTCSITREVVVEVSPEISSGLPLDTATCDTQLVLSAFHSLAEGYEWRDDAGQLLDTMPVITLEPDTVRIYTVTLIDANDCRFTDSIRVAPNGIRIAFNDPYFLCIDTEDQIVISNLDPVDTLTYQWSPDSLLLDNQATGMPTVSVQHPGVFPFSFTVSNQFGCSHTDSLEVVIVDTTQGADLIEYAQCEELVVNFINSGDFAEYYQWDFGVPGIQTDTATGANVTYTYPDTGTYQVRLFLPGSTCPDTLFLEVEVVEGPYLEANFGFTFDSCVPGEVVIAFSDSSFHIQTDIIDWDWTFSNGMQSDEVNPVLTVTDDQVLTATLVVTSIGNCIDTFSQLIEIDSVPDLFFSDVLFACPGSPVFLNPNGDSSYAYQWSPAGPLDSDTVVNPLATVFSTTDFFVTTQVPSGSATCPLLDTVTVTVMALDNIVVTEDTLVTCDSTVQISAEASIPGLVYWVNTQGDTVGLGDTIIVPAVNETLFIARIADSVGCVSDDTTWVFANFVQIEGLEEEYRLCLGEPLELSVTNLDSADQLMYLWEPDSLITGSNAGPSVMLATDQPGVYEVFVSAENQHGCIWSDSTELTVIEIEVAADTINTCDSSVQLQATTNASGAVFWLTPQGDTVGQGSPLTVSPVNSSIYIARVTDSGGCIAEDTSWVFANYIQVEGLDSAYRVCRYDPFTLGLVNLDTADQLTYNWQPDNLFSGSHTQNPVAINTAKTGMYTVTVSVENQHGCSWVDSTALMIAAVEVSADTLMTCDSIATISASANIPGLITWVNTQGDTLGQGDSLEVNTINENLYIAQLTDAGGCIASDTSFVSLNYIQIEGIEDQYQLCTNEAFSLNLNNLDPNDQLSYQWGPDSLFEGSTTVNPAIVNTTEPGVYEIFVGVENQHGCAWSDSATLVIVDENIDLDFDYNMLCDGVSVQFINQSTNAFSYQWDFGDNSPLSNEVNPEHIFPGVGTYLVTLTTGFEVSCADTIQRMIMVADTQLAADFVAEYEDCQEEQVLVRFIETSTNPENDIVNWEWYIDGQLASTDSTFVFATPDTTVEVLMVVTTIADCVDSLSRTFTFASVPNYEIPDTTIGCEGVGAFLNPNADSSLLYTWTPGNGLSDPSAPNPLATPDVTTTYTVSILNIQHDTCERVEEVTVVVPPAISLNSPDDFLTCDTLVTLTATSSTDSLIWLDMEEVLLSDSGSVVVSPVNESIYILQATDAFGCQERDTIQVDGRRLNLALPDELIACRGDAVEVVIENLDSADVLDVDFLPTSIVTDVNTNLDGDVILTVSADSAATFFLSLSIENQFGCTVADTVKIVFNDTTGLAASLHYGQCDGNTVNFLSTHPNAEELIWIFGDPDNPAASDTGAAVSYTYPDLGSYNVQVILPGPPECSANLILPIEVVEAPFFDLGFDWMYDACEDPIEISVTNQTAHVQDTIVFWQWALSTGDTINDPNFNLTLDSSQQLEIELYVLTLVGCEATFRDTLDLRSVDLGLADSLAICPEDSVQLNPGGDPMNQYQWSPASSLDNPRVPDPLAFPDSSTLYEVVVLMPLPGDTCRIDETVFVEVYPDLVFTGTDDQAYCQDPGEVTLSIQSDASFTVSWSDSPTFDTILGTNPSLAIIPDRPSVIYANIQDEFGCPYQDTITIANFEPDVDIEGPVQVCIGEEVELMANNVYPGDTLDYFWTPLEGILEGENTSSPLVGPETTQYYYVEYLNQYGCLGFDTVKVTVVGQLLEDVVAVASPDTISRNGTSYLEATFGNNLSYSWTPTTSIITDPNSFNPRVEPPQTTTYTVVVTTSEGCTVERTVTVTVVDRPCDDPFIFVPRAFTPNNDGENDILYVYGNPIDEMELIIYNRWGEQVFRSVSQDQGWDGTFNGKELPPDVYGYYLTVRCFNQDTYVSKGNITLLR